MRLGEGRILKEVVSKAVKVRSSWSKIGSGLDVWM